MHILFSKLQVKTVVSIYKEKWVKICRTSVWHFIILPQVFEQSTQQYVNMPLRLLEIL